MCYLKVAITFYVFIQALEATYNPHLKKTSINNDNKPQQVINSSSLKELAKVATCLQHTIKKYAMLNTKFCFFYI